MSGGCFVILLHPLIFKVATKNMYNLLAILLVAKNIFENLFSNFNIKTLKKT